MDTTQHWNTVYSEKQDCELGWYEADASFTLDFLAGIPLKAQRIALTGVGTSTLVGALKAAQPAQLILNDISTVALDKCANAFGLGSEHPRITLDLGAPCANSPFPPSDLWIDRAVLHFLTSAEQRLNYAAHLQASVVQGGHVLLAEFAKGGAPKCSGLDVFHYDIAEMQALLGPNFTLVRERQHTYFNPAGHPRPYTYGLFQRQRL